MGRTTLTGGYDHARNAVEVERNRMHPVYQQYREAKAAHPAMVLLFRMGDFYEAFDDDARTLSQVIGLTLTKRGDSPMCGFPHPHNNGCAGVRVSGSVGIR